MADQDGWTPLHWAAWIGHQDVAKLLLDGGADLNMVTQHGGTPLHWAANNGRKTVVQLLLERGAWPNIRDQFGRTPLSYASRKYMYIANILTQNGGTVERGKTS